MSICVVLGNCIYIPDTIRSKESDKEIGREFSCGTNEIVFFFVLRETHYLSGIKRISLSDHGKKGCTYSMLHGRENKKSPIKQPKCSGCFFFLGQPLLIDWLLVRAIISWPRFVYQSVDGPRRSAIDCPFDFDLSRIRQLFSLGQSMFAHHLPYLSGFDLVPEVDRLLAVDICQFLVPHFLTIPFNCE